MVALAGALAAGPGLLRRNFANLRLALPVALIASACAIVGAMLGLALPTHIIQTCLGATILGIAVLLLLSKNSVRPVVTKQDADILQLQQQMRLLAKRIDELSFTQGDGSEEITNERPPHY